MNNVKDVLKERFLLQHEYLGENKPVNNIIPLVSVTVATYQHVNYIRACLDGILMQKTNFLYEIILGEDGSIDGTQDICKEYAAKYPDKIRLFLRNRTLSQYVADNGRVIRFNGIWNRMSARGKYIAWCEGDDYWIDPLKLQKQVDFLEKNLEYGLVHTDFNIVNDSNIAEYRVRRTVDFSENVFNSLLLGTYDLGTLTVLFRRSLYESLPHYYFDQNFLMGDLPLWIEFAYYSRIKYLPDKTACYRRLNNSASHSQNFNKRMAFIDNLLKCRLFYMDKLGCYNLRTKILKNHSLICLKIFSMERGRWYTLKYYFRICKKYPSLLLSKGLYYVLVAFFPLLPKLVIKLLNK